MFISILSVDVTTRQGPKSSYQQAEVAYREDGGKVGSKKIMSFDKSGVFKVMANAKQGETYEIGLTKGEKYWEWTSAKKAAAPASSATNVGAASSKGNVSTAGSTSRGFETPEERKQKQLFIVRQSSLSNAIATLTISRKTTLDPKEVIDLAKQYTAYVFGVDEEKVISQDIEKLDDDLTDLPF